MFPSPDVLRCARRLCRVKFGAFYEYLQEGGHGGAFDRIASGHYARVTAENRLCRIQTILGHLLPMFLSKRRHMYPGLTPACAVVEQCWDSQPYLLQES